MMQTTNTLGWDAALLSRYNLNGPRYTSYPTAPQFSPDFSGENFAQAVRTSTASGSELSLYFHIPFCETLCYYCGCHKLVTPNKDRAMPYLTALDQEMALMASHIGAARPVTQLHWGGGTPTYISEREMTWLMTATRKHFSLRDDDHLEASVEVHPGRMPISKVHCLRDIGFNRLSMGVQDFNPQVQAAVNRYNSVAQVQEVMQVARDRGFRSISMDIIYGLPCQTLDTLDTTLREVIALSPDRISAFGYAHMPHLFKSQRLIADADLPDAGCKLAMLQLIVDRLQAAGYVYIGMDHFAKADDSLTRAQQQRALYRNFQGYSTHKGCDLLAFGVSAISYFGNTYIKNGKNLRDYQAQLAQGRPAYVAGAVLSDEDLLRKDVISELICHFELPFARINQRFGINFSQHFAAELQALAPLVADGLLRIDEQGLVVSHTGRLLIRRICMAFDQYLAASVTPQYSKVI